MENQTLFRIREPWNKSKLVGQKAPLAVKVFGSEDSAYSWLNEYNTALQGKPIEIAQSKKGLSSVVENLGAILYGGVA